MKLKFCVKKCQENVLQFMFLYILRTPPPPLELKSVEKCGLYTGKDDCGSCVCYRGRIVVMDVLTLCKYDLRKGDLFVLGWARV